MLVEYIFNYFKTFLVKIKDGEIVVQMKINWKKKYLYISVALIFKHQEC